ncbi:MAG: redoxin domain-containing protein [Pseudomonadota bacterium]
MTLRSLLHGAFVALITSSLVYSMALTSGHADVPIAATADDIQPLQVGDPAPRFIVENVDGSPYDFDPNHLDKPTLLLTFRGGWCPYCNTYLSDMRFVIPEIRDMGVDVLFLSGDRAAILYDSLSKEAQEDIEGLDYTILSDANAQAAIALGIAFRANERTRNYVRGKGALENSSIDRHGVLPVPAVFAVDSAGVIRYAFTNPNYKVRLPADELLAVARQIAAE